MSIKRKERKHTHTHTRPAAPVQGLHPSTHHPPNNFCQFRGDLGLASPVVDEREAVHHVLCIGGGVVHGHHTLGGLTGSGFKHGVKECGRNAVLLEVDHGLAVVQGLNLVSLELGQVLLRRLRGRGWGGGRRKKWLLEHSA